MFFLRFLKGPRAHPGPLGGLFGVPRGLPRASWRQSSSFSSPLMPTCCHHKPSDVVLAENIMFLKCFWGAGHRHRGQHPSRPGPRGGEGGAPTPPWLGGFGLGRGNNTFTRHWPETSGPQEAPGGPQRASGGPKTGPSVARARLKKCVKTEGKRTFSVNGGVRRGKTA